MRSSAFLALICGVTFSGCSQTPQDAPKGKPEPSTSQQAKSKAEEPKTSSVLDVAKRLASTRYSGWTYGSSADKKQVDCVQFLAEVVFEIEPQKKSNELRKNIYIDNLEKDEQNQEAFKRLLKAKDKRMTGVQSALVDAGIGKAIPVSDVRPGDLVQYWIYLKNGNVMGHAAIIEHIRQGESGVEVQIYGSHKRTNGIATADFWLPLTGADREVFLVRMGK